MPWLRARRFHRLMAVEVLSWLSILALSNGQYKKQNNAWEAKWQLRTLWNTECRQASWLDCMVWKKSKNSQQLGCRRMRVEGHRLSQIMPHLTPQKPSFFLAPNHFHFKVDQTQHHSEGLTKKEGWHSLWQKSLFLCSSWTAPTFSTLIVILSPPPICHTMVTASRRTAGIPNLPCPGREKTSPWTFKLPF